MFLLIVLAVIYYVAHRLHQRFFPTPNINPIGKYVLISGCDTGFGHGLAIELDREGFNVLAGVYLSDNVTSMQAKLSIKATVFHLDITKQEDIDAAFDLVKKKTNTLHALVNNAGIAPMGHIDWTSLERMRKVMDVNFFGHVAMTKTFLPLLIAKRDSRVVNLCSISGFITFPGVASYSASKYALESFSDCLRREMVPWGLRVSIIEPGGMRTPLIEGLEKSLRDLWSELSADVQERWGEDYLLDVIKVALNNPLGKNAEDPYKVVRAIEHAVMNTNPRIRYRPGWQSSLVLYPLSLLPAWLVDKLLLNATTSVPNGVRMQLKT
jgi:NAD(P)-dependent dehydrogenase (short-subunit alcohol dehydrogenase family)